MSDVTMRMRRWIAAMSLVGTLLVLLGVATAVDAHLGAVWRVAVQSIDDPAGQEHDEAAPANAPLVHRGGEAARWIAGAVRALARLTPGTERATFLAVAAVAAPRAPPAA
jgi:hypothetical protein